METFCSLDLILEKKKYRGTHNVYQENTQMNHEGKKTEKHKVYPKKRKLKSKSRYHLINLELDENVFHS